VDCRDFGMVLTFLAMARVRRLEPVAVVSPVLTCRSFRVRKQKEQTTWRTGMRTDQIRQRNGEMRAEEL
jgi:hypothetical protein